MATLTKSRPQYVNQSKRGTRPVAGRYLDQPGILLRTAKAATQISQANFTLYDGRLHRRSGYTAAEINSFRRLRRSSHKMVELAKGLVVAYPELLTARRETFVMMMVEQLLDSVGVRPPATWHDILRVIEQAMPIAAINRAISLVVRHDLDIEKKFNVNYWGRHMPGRLAPHTAADRKDLVEDFVKRRYQATARSALTQAMTANAYKQRFVRALNRAPTLDVWSYGGHLGRGQRILTQAEILGI